MVFAGDLTHSVSQNVSIGIDGTADIEIVVPGDGDVFAGAQFELILSEGVTIEGVSFNLGNNTNIIPPTPARGSYFFSLFSGTNGFEGDIICTVTVAYAGTEPAQVTVAEIQRYSIDSPGEVSTIFDSTQSIIQILPEGYIEDGSLPAGFLKQDRPWIIIVVIIAAVIAVLLVLLRMRNKKAALDRTQGESGNETITIDKAEYERLLAGRTESERRTDSDP